MNCVCSFTFVLILNAIIKFSFESIIENAANLTARTNVTGLSKKQKSDSRILKMPPRIVSRELVYSFEVNQKDRKMTCAIDQHTPANELNWIHLNEKDMDLKEVEHEVRELYPNIWIIRFSIIKERHAGNYSCIAKNEYGETQQTFVLKVTKNYATNMVLYLVFVFGTLSLLAIVLSMAFCYGRYCFICGKKSSKTRKRSIQEKSVFDQPIPNSSGPLDFRKNVYSTIYNYLDLNDL